MLISVYSWLKKPYTSIHEVSKIFIKHVFEGIELFISSFHFQIRTSVLQLVLRVCLVYCTLYNSR